MAIKILVMGLPESGKTTLSIELVKQLRTISKTVGHLNADEIRKQYNDWDFSEEGRIRQANRMFKLSEDCTFDYVIADFVCPLPETRNIYSADFTVWVNTIVSSRFGDTNQAFIEPDEFNLCVTTQDAEYWAGVILHLLKVEE